MLQPSQIGRFFFFLALIYSVLMVIPFPGVRPGYAYLFRAADDVVFARFWFWPEGSVRFVDLNSPDLFTEVDAVTAGRLPPGLKLPRAEGIKDTLMVVMNRSTPASIGLLRISSRYVGYVPMAVFLSLVLASPMPWSRKGWAILWGALLVHAFIVFRVTLTLVAKGFSGDKAYALFHPRPFWMNVLNRADVILSDNPTVSFVVPTFIWFIVSLRLGALGSDQGKPQ